MMNFYKHMFANEIASHTDLQMQLDASKQALLGALNVTYLRTYRMYLDKGVSPAADDVSTAIVDKKILIAASAAEARAAAAARAAALVSGASAPAPAQGPAGSRGFFPGLWAL